ncbi:HEPN domain-containing protein [Glutamicibacter sp. 0426]|uniref:HEPN domain-containing protein n=1 Tax=Glutamicibacter sp. 0426 TaxID=1913445 RepID=UPI001160FD9B|nr:HEPN domain-containing protein [Glutamicibacter sp. 0426]
MTNHPLLAEIAEIDNTLLSTVTTAPPDPLSADERTRTRAYLLLCHAVLEERIENIFIEHFNRALELISSDKPIPREILPFYAASMEWGVNFLPTYSKRNWLGFMSNPQALEHVTSVIKKNHGLKMENVRDLAKLVGIEWGVIDDAAGVEMSALTTLGVKRGAAGHTSLFSGNDNSLSGEEYPANVREWVNQAANTVIRIEAVVAEISA